MKRKKSLLFVRWRACHALANVAGRVSKKRLQRAFHLYKTRNWLIVGSNITLPVSDGLSGTGLKTHETCASHTEIKVVELAASFAQNARGLDNLRLPLYA